MSGWPNVVGVFHKSCPKQRASYLLESTSDGTKTGPRFGCGSVNDLLSFDQPADWSRVVGNESKAINGHGRRTKEDEIYKHSLGNFQFVHIRYILGDNVIHLPHRSSCDQQRRPSCDL